MSIFRRSQRTYSKAEQERVTSFPRELGALWTPVGGGSRRHADGWKIKAPPDKLGAAVAHADAVLGVKLAG